MSNRRRDERSRMSQLQSENLSRQAAFAKIDRICVECGRRFDNTNEVDAGEWYSGHDCESG